MTNFPEYTDTDYLALGYFLRREMYGVELDEKESCMATMSILKFNFDGIEIPEVEDEMQRIEIEGKWGIISKDGWIAFPIYDYMSGFIEGFVLVRRADGKYNHINTKGELLTEEWWKDAWGFSSGGFVDVQRVEDRKWYQVDKQGNFYDKLP
jgi:hypothetical protein